MINMIISVWSQDVQTKQNTVEQMERKEGMEEGIQDTILKYLCDCFESPLGF